MTLETKRIAVIGAGPAGCTAAYTLAKKGYKVDLYEAGPHVGGMSRTLDLWGQRIDLGPHRFFSSDRRINELWLEVAGDDYRMVDRLTRIYYKKKFFYYPLKPLNALINLGPIQAVICVLSMMKEKISPTKHDGSFENWVVSRFGRRLFEIFFKAYSEKLWGITTKELDEDFAAQRIKTLSLMGAVWNALFGGRGNKHKTLVDQFAYPVGGTGMIYERMADSVNELGSCVHLSTPVESVIMDGTKATGICLEDGSQHNYDHIISSMPITNLVKRMPDVPAPVMNACHELTFRNTILVYLKVEGNDLFPDNWLYVHSPDLQMGRVTNFCNWVPEILGDTDHTVIVLEYWCYFEDDIWKADERELVALASDEIRKTGLISDAAISDGKVVRIPRCYPVYKSGYKAHLKPVENYLSTLQNLSVIGRYGAFKYNNQDHSILMGLLAAENITHDAKHNLWDINTDYDSYQEESVITSTGLEAK